MLKGQFKRVHEKVLASLQNLSIGRSGCRTPTLHEKMIRMMSLVDVCNMSQFVLILT